MTIQTFINEKGNPNSKPNYQRLYEYRNSVDSRLPYFQDVSDLILKRYNMVIHLIISGVPVNHAVAFAILYYKYSKRYNEMYIDQNITFDQISSYAETLTNPLSLSHLVTAT